MNDLISVIVPVYNVEKYLNKCIESIVNQTYTNLEIILVDDGSSDSSADIINKWVNKDKRIVSVYQKNMGGGAARNLGLDIANGNYITFVDSDDYIAPDMYEYLLSLITDDIDIAECDYLIAFEDDEQFLSYDLSTKIYNTRDALKENINDHYFKQLIWNKIYKKHLLSDIRFPINSKIDDEFFTYKVIGNARYLIHSNKICYAYRQHEKSIMHTININHLLISIEAKIQRHNYIKINHPELCLQSLNDLWYYLIYIGQKALKSKNKNERKTAIKEIKMFLKAYPNKYYKFDKTGIWIILANISLNLTCKLRNILKIGI